MSLRISGKNLDVGEAYRTHVEARISDAVSKYFDGGFTGHVTLERDGPWFKSDCLVHLDTGVVLRADGRSEDARRSFDQAADRIEKRLRRYKGRLKDHHAARRVDSIPAAAYVLAAPEDEQEVAADYSPTIIAEETTELETLTVGGAVVAMDLADLPVVVFRHAVHGGINVVYRRRDGNIGWIDPSLKTKGNSAKR